MIVKQHQKSKSLSKKDIVRKKRVAIQRSANRSEAKLIAKKVILAEKEREDNQLNHSHPDIGDVIKEFVKDHSVSRRTGVLTFDGNTNINDKVTYKKIQIHLEKVYGQKLWHNSRTVYSTEQTLEIIKELSWSG